MPKVTIDSTNGVSNNVQHQIRNDPDESHSSYAIMWISCWKADATSDLGTPALSQPFVNRAFLGCHFQTLGASHSIGWYSVVVGKPLAFSPKPCTAHSDHQHKNNYHPLTRVVSNTTPHAGRSSPAAVIQSLSRWIPSKNIIVVVKFVLLGGTGHRQSPLGILMGSLRRNMPNNSL